MSIYISGLREDDSPKAIALQTGIELETICEDYEFGVFISTYPRRQINVTAYEDTDLDDIDALDELQLLDDVVEMLTSIKERWNKMEDAINERELEREELARERAEGREFNYRTSNIDLSDYDMEDVKIRDDDDDWTIGLTD